MINVTVKPNYIRIETADNSYLIKASSNNRFTISYLWKNDNTVTYTCNAQEHRAILEAVMYNPETVDDFFSKLSDKCNALGKKRLLELLEDTKNTNQTKPFIGK